MEQGETFLGGFYDPMQLSLGRFAVGAGIYATNKRLFVFRKGTFRLYKIAKEAESLDFAPSKITIEQNAAKSTRS